VGAADFRLIDHKSQPVTAPIRARVTLTTSKAQLSTEVLVGIKTELRRIRTHALRTLLAMRRRHQKREQRLQDNLVSAIAQLQKLEAQHVQALRSQALELASTALEQYNSRAMSPEQLQQLQSSIDELLQLRPQLHNASSATLTYSPEMPEKLQQYLQSSGWQLTMDGALSALQIRLQFNTGSIDADLSRCLPQWRQILQRVF
jgi:hypothetical protein